ncbi:MAG: hypothetical protein ACOYK6_04605 [Chthoniobacterales bacterium]
MHFQTSSFLAVPLNGYDVFLLLQLQLFTSTGPGLNGHLENTSTAATMLFAASVESAQILKPCRKLAEADEEQGAEEHSTAVYR